MTEKPTEQRSMEVKRKPKPAFYALTALILTGALLFVFAVWQRSGGNKHTAIDPVLAASDVHEVSILGDPIPPIPTDGKWNSHKVELGKKLFHDVRLSHDDTLSCASCHGLDKGGTDQKAHSTGINGAVGGINAPTVYNSGLNFKQFWNGRADTLEEQVNGPTHHPKEMGSNWEEIIGKLKKDSEYPAEFAALYGGIQPPFIRDAIATFERSLQTPNSPYDRYLRGEESALSTEAKEGLRLFLANGCASCHQGANAGGNMYQQMGVMKDYFAQRGNLTEADLGRYSVTHREEDRYVFRVPSLRNIARTMPYFHDGSAKNLTDAIEVMGKYQLGRYMDPTDVAKIRKFLESLTGEYGGATL